MTSKATNVESYIAEVPAERRAVMEKLRGLCRQNLGGYEECMEYGLPCYKRNGTMEVGFASQKQYVALYQVAEKGQEPLAFARGSECSLNLCSTLLSHDRKGVVCRRPFSASC